MRKPVLGISDQIRHKIICTATKASCKSFDLARTRKFPKFSNAKFFSVNLPNKEAKP